MHACIKLKDRAYGITCVWKGVGWLGRVERRRSHPKTPRGCRVSQASQAKPGLIASTQKLLSVCRPASPHFEGRLGGTWQICHMPIDLGEYFFFSFSASKPPSRPGIASNVSARHSTRLGPLSLHCPSHKCETLATPSPTPLPNLLPFPRQTTLQVELPLVDRSTYPVEPTTPRTKPNTEKTECSAPNPQCE